MEDVFHKDLRVFFTARRTVPGLYQIDLIGLLRTLLSWPASTSALSRAVNQSAGRIAEMGSLKDLLRRHGMYREMSEPQALDLGFRKVDPMCLISPILGSRVILFVSKLCFWPWTASGHCITTSRSFLELQLASCLTRWQAVSGVRRLSNHSYMRPMLTNRA